MRWGSFVHSSFLNDLSHSASSELSAARIARVYGVARCLVVQPKIAIRSSPLALIFAAALRDMGASAAASGRGVNARTGSAGENG
jgi:ABC-type taurine transport system ATPase subunit